VLRVRYIKDFQYMVSLYCPGRCVGCGIWKQGKSALEGEIPLEAFEKVLLSESMSKLSYIILTGGESIISEKFADVVKLIAKHHPNAVIHINTSGYFPEKIEKTIRKCLEYVSSDKLRIDISMDGPPEVYKKIRKVEDGFNMAVDTLERLKKVTDNLRYVFTIFKLNYKEMDWLVQFAKDAEVGYYYEFAREASFLDNVGKTDGLLSFDKEDIAYIEERLNRYNFIDRLDRKIKWKRACSIYSGSNMPFECRSGFESIVMDPYGNVYPCLENREALHMGNISEYGDDMDALLKDKKTEHILDIVKNRGCQPCTMLCVHQVGSSEEE